MRHLISVTLLCLPVSLASAASFGTSIEGAAVTLCAPNGKIGPEQPPLGVGSGSASSGPCLAEHVFPEAAQIAVSVDPFSIGSTISGSAFSKGVGATAGASATCRPIDWIHF